MKAYLVQYNHYDTVMDDGIFLHRSAAERRAEQLNLGRSDQYWDVWELDLNTEE